MYENKTLKPTITIAKTEAKLKITLTETFLICSLNIIINNPTPNKIENDCYFVWCWIINDYI